MQANPDENNQHYETVKQPQKELRQIVQAFDEEKPGEIPV
jgi:hypothetical protein